MAEGKIPPDIAKMSFEDALEELQRIVGQLEKGEGKLDQAIEGYKRGAALKQHCEAKQQIDKIALGSGGTVEAEPFEVD